MSIEKGPSPGIEQDPLAKFHLSEAERRFCTPQPRGSDLNTHDLFEIFPELDALLEKVDLQSLPAHATSGIDFHRTHKGASGSILGDVSDFLDYVGGRGWAPPENVQKYSNLPEFKSLKEHYKRLSDAHGVGFKEKMEDAFRGAMAFEAEKEKGRQSARERGEGYLPPLGVKGTWETPDGFVEGVIEPGAQMGGPYTIKGPQGKIRVSKIIRRIG